MKRWQRIQSINSSRSWDAPFSRVIDNAALLLYRRRRGSRSGQFLDAETELMLRSRLRGLLAGSGQLDWLSGYWRLWLVKQARHIGQLSLRGLALPTLDVQLGAEPVAFSASAMQGR
jgi:hypothetical protein